MIATGSDFDYVVLNSRVHMLWSVKRGNYMGTGPTTHSYTRRLRQNKMAARVQ